MCNSRGCPVGRVGRDADDKHRRVWERLSRGEAYSFRDYIDMKMAEAWKRLSDDTNPRLVGLGYGTTTYNPKKG